MTEIDLNKGLSRLQLPTFTFNKVKYQVRRMTRDEVKKNQQLEEKFTDEIEESADFDQLAETLCKSIDILVEPAVPAGKGGKKLSTFLREGWKSGDLAWEDLLYVHYQIRAAKDEAIRPT